MIDCHTHTKYSHDSTQDPREAIEAAISKGIEYLAFTDHCDRDCLYSPLHKDKIRQIDLDACMKEIRSLKEEYKGKIEIAVGIECGYMEKAVKNYVEDLNAHKTDITINSIHLVDYTDCYFKEFFDGRSKAEAYTMYTKAILDSLFVPYHYDVVAHIGYVSRKAPYEDKMYRYSDLKDIIDEILKTIIEKGKSLEINSHAENTGDLTLPNLDIIKRYKELGGELLTFASDAHKIEKQCYMYNEIVDRLKDCGFNYLFKYLEHKPIAVKI